jgi:hypothetical protein
MESRGRLLFAKMQMFFAGSSARSGPTRKTMPLQRNVHRNSGIRFFGEAGDAANPFEILRNFGVLSEFSEENRISLEAPKRLD